MKKIYVIYLNGYRYSKDWMDYEHMLKEWVALRDKCWKEQQNETTSNLYIGNHCIVVRYKACPEKIFVYEWREETVSE